MWKVICFNWSEVVIRRAKLHYQTSFIQSKFCLPKIKSIEYEDLITMKKQQGEEECYRRREEVEKNSAAVNSTFQSNLTECFVEKVKLTEALSRTSDAYKFSATMNITEYLLKYRGLDNGDRLQDVQVSLAGRITSKRPCSKKLFFYGLCDDDAKVQIVADAQSSGLEQSEFFNLHSSVKLEDSVCVSGFPGKPKSGKLSIFPGSFMVLPHNRKPDSSLKDKDSSPVKASSSFRVVVVGDIHEDWELQQDYKALQFLQPNLVLFTGDFGNENVELVRSVSGIDMPKAAILGNHDSWNTTKFKTNIKDGVQIQLECLGEQHVGYNHLDFPALKLSVVGGRPFSIGGEKLFRKELLKKRYGVRNMEQSAEQIYKAALGTPKEHSIIFLAHNGPTGLGSNTDDICGKSWDSEGGDYGDPDLAQAIFRTKETANYPIPLVVFGHMHKELEDGKQRKMMVIVDKTMYLNGAIVPRVKTLSSVGSLRAFTVVEFSNGEITKVAETWVSVIDDNISLEEEHLLFSSNRERSRSAL